MIRFLNLTSGTLILTTLAFAVTAGQLQAEDGASLYLNSVKPLLAAKCGACHGAWKQEAGLRLDAGQLIVAGSENGTVIDLENVEASPLLARVTSADLETRMPPEGEGEALTATQVELVRNWIQRGAWYAADESIPGNPRDHWAYQIPQRPKLPVVAHPGGSSNPIDAFIAEQYVAAGVVPAELADARTLVRRLYFDLIGLPPDRAELAKFLSDSRPDAYERLVDQLLENPQHAERWARHWMDVWRYSDWDGYRDQLRGSQRHIWRWRDWIVQSLDADRPYDQMIIEMLAADELAPEDEKALSATGFLARNFHNSNRNIWLDATVEHTTKAFLGLTLKCARCHDHKFDPILQTDYYAFRAIFEPHQVRTERLPGESDLLKLGLARAFDAELEAPTYLFRRGDEKHPDEANPIAAAVPVVFGTSLDISSVDLPVRAWYPVLRASIEAEEMAKANGVLAAASRTLEKTASSDTQSTHAANDSDGNGTASLELRVARAERDVALANVDSLAARWAAERTRYLPNPERATDAEHEQLLVAAAAKAQRQQELLAAELNVLKSQLAVERVQAEHEKEPSPDKLATASKQLDKARSEWEKIQAASQESGNEYEPVGKIFPQTSSGRRLALARWIGSRRNPLTARVAVNQIWMRHFGQPLVANVFDFGLRSAEPQHAKLLDWLAVEFMDHGWRMKHIHRLIVTSQTWQLASTVSSNSSNRQRDPDNRLFWKANVRRLEAEVIRDSVLQVAGSLDTTLGGPDIAFAEGETVYRRSLYFQHAYEKQMTMLVLFDAASPNECYQRSESVIPQQALVMSNSDLSLSQSRILARTLWQESQSEGEEAFVVAAFQQMLARPPASEELISCLRFLESQRQRLSDPERLTQFEGGTEAAVPPNEDPAARARENFVHVLMNHNDFVTVR